MGVEVYLKLSKFACRVMDLKLSELLQKSQLLILDTFVSDISLSNSISQGVCFISIIKRMN